jgi:hypothetical protein
MFSISELILFRQRLDDFLGVLGGNLGLYIGASLISILEILLFLVTGLFKIVTHIITCSTKPSLFKIVTHMFR